MTVVKIIELIGSSPNNWEDAVKVALTEAAKTVDNIKSIYVKSCKAKKPTSQSTTRTIAIVNQMFIANSPPEVKLQV